VGDGAADPENGVEPTSGGQDDAEGLVGVEQEIAHEDRGAGGREGQEEPAGRRVLQSPADHHPQAEQPVLDDGYRHQYRRRRQEQRDHQGQGSFPVEDDQYSLKIPHPDGAEGVNQGEDEKCAEPDEQKT